MALFSNAFEAYKRYTSSVGPFPRSVDEPSEHCRPSAALSGLNPLHLSDMEFNIPQIGRVVRGFLAVDPRKDPFYFNVIVSVFVDESGAPIFLSICNISVDLCIHKFVKGARVAIKEPLIINRDCIRVLEVENPASIHIISSFSEEKMAKLVLMDSVKLREHGNSFFKQGKLEAAAELYKMSINKAVLDGDDNALLLAYSNRSEVYLQQGKFESALRDSNRALSLDSLHVKTLFRKGRALHELQQYNLACRFLEQAWELQKSSRDLNSALQKSRLFLEQSQGGTHDLSHCFMDEGSSIPACADFSGPVEMKSSSGKGRGLFATRDIKVGDLVMVSNALAFVKPGTESSYADTMVKVLEKVMASARARHQINSLEISASKRRSDVPPKSLFVPNASSEEEILLQQGEDEEDQMANIDPASIYDAILNTIYHPTSVSYSKDGQAKETCVYVALWLLPAFLNNSCCPNLANIEMGGKSEVVYYIAAKDIAAGEELTICYAGAMNPLADRRDALEGFECMCFRCRLEAAVSRNLEGISVAYSSEYRKWIHAISDPISAFKLANVASMLEHRIGSMKLEFHELQWVRTTFFYAYKASFVNETATSDSEGLPSPEAIIEALAACLPGHPRVEFEVLLLLPYVNDLQRLKQALDKIMLARYGHQRPSMMTSLKQKLINNFISKFPGLNASVCSFLPLFLSSNA